ncbi:hypothetical protein [Pararhodobacter sp. SW119]|uniref:hypothetical protein n=1 Tax=Pararhodobacter sp. SW119 TaxID=2780075 RepID=UPI001ADF89CE|nr:hypothetical protein [Pararhodobacter sp. SW119]
MFEAVGVENLVLGLSVGGSLVGLGAVGLMLQRKTAPVPQRRLDAIVQGAPYDRLGNTLKVAKD